MNRDLGSRKYVDKIRKDPLLLVSKLSAWMCMMLSLSAPLAGLKIQFHSRGWKELDHFPFFLGWGTHISTRYLQ